MLVLVLAVAAVGCGRTGEATIRLNQAEDELDTITDELVELLELDVREREDFGRPTVCDLPTAGDGAVTDSSLRAPLPDVDDLTDRASAVLVEAGYEVTDEGLEEGVYGRRQGIRVTVEVDRPSQQVLIDTSTGCRPV